MEQTLPPADPLPVGRLLVGVDAGLPLHRALLLAGAGSPEPGGALRCCHGARWDSALLGAAWSCLLRRLSSSQMLLNGEQRVLRALWSRGSLPGAPAWRSPRCPAVP